MKLCDSGGGINYIMPISSGITRSPHPKRIGPAIWLFMLLEDRVTTGKGEWGIVRGGQPQTDLELAETLGLDRKTTAEHRRRLRKHGYIQAVRTGSGYQYLVAKSKKWALLQERERYRRGKPSPKAPLGEMSEIPAKMSEIPAARLEKLPSRSDVTVDVRKTAAAAAASTPHQNPEAWRAIGLDRPIGHRDFRRLWETSWASRNGRPLSQVMGDCADSWQAAGGKVPGPFFAALARIRQQANDLPRLEAPAWKR